MENLSELTKFVIILSICVAAVSMSLIVLVFMLTKYGKSLSFKFGNKNESSDSNNEFNKKIFNIDIFKQNALSHKFFTEVKLHYVETDYGFDFNLYDKMIEHGVKQESKDLIEFKKLLANTFLSKCLFKYIESSTRKWILALIEEYESSEDLKKNAHKIPNSMTLIIENLVHFTKETSNLASTVNLTYKGKNINGIPIDFIKTFCEIINSRIDIVQELFNGVIYTSQLTWDKKVIEILDVYILALDYLITSVDSTLALLNGQMERFVESIMKNNRPNKEPININ